MYFSSRGGGGGGSGSISAKNGGDVDIFYSIDYVVICDSRYIELQIT